MNLLFLVQLVFQHFQKEGATNKPFKSESPEISNDETIKNSGVVSSSKKVLKHFFNKIFCTEVFQKLKTQ